MNNNQKQRSTREITMEIEVDFNKFFPSIAQLLSYFETLKLNGFIKDVEIVENESNEPSLRVLKREIPQEPVVRDIV